MGGDAWGLPDAERDRLAAVERAADCGITFFDTAPNYGAGASEILLGHALARRREHVAIATKVGPRDDPRTSLEASLRRLKSEYVDLVQLHEALDRWEWQLDKLYQLQEEGKARALGLSNATSRQLARARALVPLASYQGPYNLFDRDVEQRELPWCREHGIAFLAYRPLAAGLLSGKYPTPPQFPEGDHRRKLYWFTGPEFARRRRVIERLEAVAHAGGTSVAALALGWVLARPGVSIALAGARTAAQVDRNVAAAERPLTASEVSAIDALVAEAFRPPHADEALRTRAAAWGARERYIVDQLDGDKSYETIAAEWTDHGDPPMVAAQVKVFVDQLAAQGLITG